MPAIIDKIGMNCFNDHMDGQGGIKDNLSVKPDAINTPEAVSGIKRFSDEQREHLRTRGYEFFEIPPTSIGKMHNEGKEFTDYNPKNVPFDTVENLPSTPSEIAINTNQPFIPGSNKKEYAEQNKMIEALSEEINKENPGVKAVRGGVTDLSSIAFQYQERTGKELFPFFVDGEYSIYGTQTKLTTASFATIATGDNDRQVTLGWRKTEEHPEYVPGQNKNVYAPYIIVPES